MRNIIVVGCGNIGSRLIQALSNIDSKAVGKMAIIGVEPFPKAWPVVESRFAEENKGGHRLQMVSSPDELPPRADLIVFAMDARNRLKAMCDVLAVCRPTNVVLEKILFTKWADYGVAKHIIADTGAMCWVNTSRNIWPGYKDLKETLNGAKVLEFTVSGSDWGLGCNAIHFLSALEYISGETITQLGLHIKTVDVLESKRAGYKEVTGTLTGRTEEGAIVSISSLSEMGHPICVQVKTEMGDFSINESGRVITHSRSPNKETTFDLRFTSQLHDMFEEILVEGQSNLPQLESSTNLHRYLILALNEAFYGEASLAHECPIT